jgi:hypothetical protein
MPVRVKMNIANGAGKSATSTIAGSIGTGTPNGDYCQSSEPYRVSREKKTFTHSEDSQISSRLPFTDLKPPFTDSSLKQVLCPRIFAVTFIIQRNNNRTTHRFVSPKLTLTNRES